MIMHILSIFYEQLQRISREVCTVFYAEGSKINEIWSLTAGIPRLAKKTVEQAGIHHKPQRGKSSRMLLLQGMDI